jgi:hypothetical protein
MAARADGPIVAVTPEQVYIRILLLQLLDGGQFRPEEIAGRIERLSTGARSPIATFPYADHDERRTDSLLLAVRRDSRASMRRPAGGALARSTPIEDAINAAIAERGDVPPRRQPSCSPDNKACSANCSLYAPHQRPKRRGERTAVTLMSVESALGGTDRCPGLNDEPMRDRGTNRVHAGRDEIMITDVNAMGRWQSCIGRLLETAANAGCDVLRSIWHIRDRSDSGPRLRGRVPDALRLLPGLLVAFRDDKDGPWTVAVARRFNRMIGNNVEIGVEHIGRNPQRIILLSGVGGRETGEESETSPDRVVALYLTESGISPKIAIKTLLVPACEFAPGRLLTMMSTMREVVIRLRSR